MTATLIVKFERTLPGDKALVTSHARLVIEQNGLLVTLCKGTNEVDREWIPFLDFPEMKDLHDGLGWDIDAVHEFLSTYYVLEDDLEIPFEGLWMLDTALYVERKAATLEALVDPRVM